MQQRLGLAVALVGDPDLVILDEPTSALDPLGRADVRDLVLRLRERGTAVVLNSHLIGEVERVCDRVVILDRGHVVTSGTLAQLLGRRRLRLQLAAVSPAAAERLARTGAVTREGDWYTVELGQDDAPDAAGDAAGHAAAETAVPDLVGDLVALGVRVHAVEPDRISLEDRVLGLLRTPEGDS
jgi:ABC-2 type transport system ATP-binding protein